MYNILCNLVFALIIGLGNGWIAKQLEFTQVTDARLSDIFKAQWHNHMMLPLRMLYPLTIGFFSGDFISVSVIGLSIQFLTYDSLIDIARGRFSFRYVGTCEGKWDFVDCFWLWLQARGVNHLIIKILVVALIIYLMV